MRKFVDKDQLRLACKRCVEVEFGQLAAAVFIQRQRDGIQPLYQRKRLLAAMCLDNPDDRIDPFLTATVPSLQHGIGLPHTSRCAEENLQPATLLFLFVTLDLVEQLVGIGPVHQLAGFSSSSARFRFSTFTRASPRMPN